MLVSIAHAQDAGAAATGAAGGLVQFAPIALIFVIFYFLLIRPQQQRQKELKGQIAALKRGDRVVTAGGVLAVVQKVQDKEVDVEIAPGVRVTVLRETLGSVVRPVPANDAKAVRTA